MWCHKIIPASPLANRFKAALRFKYLIAYNYIIYYIGDIVSDFKGKLKLNEDIEYADFLIYFRCILIGWNLLLSWESSF